MIRSLNSMHTGEAPWSPDVYVPKPEPMETHVPHRFCVLMLKGCSTRWCETEEELRAIVAGLGRKPFKIFQFFQELGYYDEVALSTYTVFRVNVFYSTIP